MQAEAKTVGDLRPSAAGQNCLLHQQSSFDIDVGEAEGVALLGANGAGKSTTLRAISGPVRLTSGTITFCGKNAGSLPPYRVTDLGIAHVPEGRQVLREMTVQENLEIGADLTCFFGPSDVRK